ncbi:MAG: hypothetical protein CMC11_06795, partial [Flavobacteriaceae bacterium]|nr:hypothetical protein [Flavobacteriaceae bacterium]
LVQEIKKNILIEYNGPLEKLHHLDNCEEISSTLVTNLKKIPEFKKLFKIFLKEINFFHENSYWDQFRVRVAPAQNKFSYREASRINSHRDTWGTNIHQQINWWAPISSISETNTMIFYPDYFSKPVKNSTSTWDLNTYLEHRKREDFSYPSAPQLLEDLPQDARVLSVNIEPGEILCFSGCHLHSSSKEKSDNTRFSYEIRTICQDDLDNRREAPNTDCDLQWQFPKIFRNINDNSPLKFTS